MGRVRPKPPVRSKEAKIKLELWLDLLQNYERNILQQPLLRKTLSKLFVLHLASLISFHILNLSFRIMDAIEIVERGLSKIEDSATIDAAIQTTETVEEKQKDEGWSWKPKLAAPVIDFKILLD